MKAAGKNYGSFRFASKFEAIIYFENMHNLIGGYDDLLTELRALQWPPT